MSHNDEKTGVKNERSSPRINIVFPLIFTTISTTDFEEEKRRLPTIPATGMDTADISSLNIDEKGLFHQISVNNPDMALIWQSLNTKLNLIIDILNEHVSADTVVGKTNGHCVDLSGNGIGIMADGKFKYGRLIKLSLSPPSKEPFKVTAVGKIMRVERIKSTPEKDVKLGVDFLLMNEVDQELLIIYTSKRDREDIPSTE
ncbi:MAG: PilZ domain-containing protein [Nitrospinota bacterium]